MNQKQRNELLVDLLKELRNADTYSDRYEFWTIAESIVTEYEDMDYVDTWSQIQLIRNR